MDCSLSGFSTHGILQARILEWVTTSFSRGSVWPRDWTQVSCIGRQILYHWATWEIQLVMQIEITRSEHLRSVHMAKMKKDWQMKCWWKCGATGTFVRCLYELPTAAQQYDHKYSSWQWHMLTSHSFSRIEVYLRLGWVLCKVPIKMPTGAVVSHEAWAGQDLCPSSSACWQWRTFSSSWVPEPGVTFPAACGLEAAREVTESRPSHHLSHFLLGRSKSHMPPTLKGRGHTKA